MIPIPTARVFRSRRGALTWSFWVIVAAVMAAGFADPPTRDTPPASTSTDARALETALEAMNAS